MARATAKYYPPIGSVSEGTLRTEDLLDTFAYELRTHIKRMRLTREQRKRFRDLLRRSYNVIPITDDRFDHNGEYASGLVNELQEALNEIAPPYAWFGASDGDGACFGFWPVTGRYSDLDDLPKIPAGDEIPREHWGEDVLIVNDHGNVDCGHVDRRGRFHPYWSCV